MVSISRLKKITGESMGQVMLKNLRTGPAPSIDAASYNSPGICLRPARKITIGAPNCHTVRRMNIGMVIEGLPTQPPRLILIFNEPWSTGPESPNMAFQTMAMETDAPIRDGA